MTQTKNPIHVMQWGKLSLYRYVYLCVTHTTEKYILKIMSVNEWIKFTSPKIYGVSTWINIKTLSDTYKNIS